MIPAGLISLCKLLTPVPMLNHLYVYYIADISHIGPNVSNFISKLRGAELRYYGYKRIQRLGQYSARDEPSQGLVHLRDGLLHGRIRPFHHWYCSAAPGRKSAYLVSHFLRQRLRWRWTFGFVCDNSGNLWSTDLGSSGRQIG